MSGLFYTTCNERAPTFPCGCVPPFTWFLCRKVPVPMRLQPEIPSRCVMGDEEMPPEIKVGVLTNLGMGNRMKLSGKGLKLITGCNISWDEGRNEA